MLGGENPNNRFHSPLRGKFEQVDATFNSWLDGLSVYSRRNRTAITIGKENIEHVTILGTLDEEVKLTSDNASAFLTILKVFGNARKEGSAQSQKALKQIHLCMSRLSLTDQL